MNSSSRKIHRYIGIVMLAPMVIWALTGLVFFIKPGYDDAYEILTIKTYPLDRGFSIPAGVTWEQASLRKSILGDHLLVTSNGQSQHLDPLSFEVAPIPDERMLKTLFEDAISTNSQRYGAIEKIEGTTAYTTTGVAISLDWSTLTLTQIGEDRRLISLLYKMHYLQWTPWDSVNQILGVLGLILLMVLTVFGYRLLRAGKE